MSKIHDTTRAATLVKQLRNHGYAVANRAADLIEELIKPKEEYRFLEEGEILKDGDQWKWQTPLKTIAVLQMQLQGAQEQRDEALKTVEKLTKERKELCSGKVELIPNEIDYSKVSPKTEDHDVKYLNSVIVSQAKTIHELGQS